MDNQIYAYKASGFKPNIALDTRSNSDLKSITFQAQLSSCLKVKFWSSKNCVSRLFLLQRLHTLRKSIFYHIWCHSYPTLGGRSDKFRFDRKRCLTFWNCQRNSVFLASAIYMSQFFSILLTCFKAAKLFFEMDW